MIIFTYLEIQFRISSTKPASLFRRRSLYKRFYLLGYSQKSQKILPLRLDRPKLPKIVVNVCRPQFSNSWVTKTTSWNFPIKGSIDTSILEKGYSIEAFWALFFCVRILMVEKFWKKCGSFRWIFMFKSCFSINVGLTPSIKVSIRRFFIYRRIFKSKSTDFWTSSQILMIVQTWRNV